MSRKIRHTVQKIENTGVKVAVEDDLRKKVTIGRALIVTALSGLVLPEIRAYLESYEMIFRTLFHPFSGT